MEAKNEINAAPQIVIWYGRAIICLGVLCFTLSIVAAIGNYFIEDGGVLLGLQTIYELGGLSVTICGFGVAVSRGKRWHLFGLLILIFFGSFVIGLLVMVGRETGIGNYIWAIGGAISLSLILILVVYWKELLDG